jgi:hypothetical protein
MAPWLRLTLMGVWLATTGINMLLVMLFTLFGSPWAVFSFLIGIVCLVMYVHNLRMFNEGE